MIKAVSGGKIRLSLKFHQAPQKEAVWLSDGRAPAGTILLLSCVSPLMKGGFWSLHSNTHPLLFQLCIWCGGQMSKHVSLCSKHWGRAVPEPPS